MVANLDSLIYTYSETNTNRSNALRGKLSNYEVICSVLSKKVLIPESSLACLNFSMVKSRGINSYNKALTNLL